MNTIKWFIFAVFLGLLLVVLTEIDSSMTHSQLKKDAIIYEMFVDDEN